MVVCRPQVGTGLPDLLGPERAFYAVAGPPRTMLLDYSQLVKAARRHRLRAGEATCSLGAIQCPFRNTTPTYSSATDAGCHLFGASSQRGKPATTSSSAAPRYTPTLNGATSVANTPHQRPLRPGSMVHSNMQMRALTLPDEPRLLGTSYCAWATPALQALVPLCCVHNLPRATNMMRSEGKPERQQVCAGLPQQLRTQRTS